MRKYLAIAAIYVAALCALPIPMGISIDARGWLMIAGPSLIVPMIAGYWRGNVLFVLVSTVIFFVAGVLLLVILKAQAYEEVHFYYGQVFMNSAFALSIVTAIIGAMYFAGRTIAFASQNGSAALRKEIILRKIKANINNFLIVLLACILFASLYALISLAIGRS